MPTYIRLYCMLILYILCMRQNSNCSELAGSDSFVVESHPIINVTNITCM